MNRTTLFLSTLIPAASLLLAATAPSAAPQQEMYVPAPIQVPCSMGIDRVRAGVRAGLLRRSWLPSDTGVGSMDATLDKKGKYKVVVTILYDEKSVKIGYKSSDGMQYDPTGTSYPTGHTSPVLNMPASTSGKPTIRSGYNNWVRNIEKDIAVELSRTCS
jgi:hypothetical protein